MGRDILSRLMHGARTAVFAAAITIILGQTIGITMGAIAGYFRGVVDDIIMRIVDVLFSFPDFLFAAFLSASIRTPIVKLMGDLKQQTGWEILDETIFIDYIILFGALAMVNWSGTARLIRGQILSLREQDFIRAEIALGHADLAHHQEAPDPQRNRPTRCGDQRGHWGHPPAGVVPQLLRAGHPAAGRKLGRHD